DHEIASTSWPRLSREFRSPIGIHARLWKRTKAGSSLPAFLVIEALQHGPNVSHRAPNKTLAKLVSPDQGELMDFIERLFSLSPDGGSGSTEAMVFAVVAAAVVTLFLPTIGALPSALRRCRPVQRTWRRYIIDRSCQGTG